MKKIFLAVLMICGRIAGAESDLERILNSDPIVPVWMDFFLSETVINAGNLNYFIDIAKKGINVKSSNKVRAASLRLLSKTVRRDEQGIIKNNLDVRDMILDCALKGFNDEYGSVQSEALNLLLVLKKKDLITGNRIGLVRKALESKKCYVRNLTLYQELFEMLFSEKLPIDMVAAKNNITPEEVMVEFNILLKVLNDKKASFDERHDAFKLLKLLIATGLLNEHVIDQFLPAVLKEVINPEVGYMINIIWMCLGMLRDKPERINQVIAACCQGAISQDEQNRAYCLMMLMWLVDGKLIKTIDQAQRVVKAMRVGMQDTDEYVQKAAFELRESLYNKGFLKRGMLSASIARGFSSKPFVQNNESSELAKLAFKQSGMNSDKFMQGTGSAVSSI